MTDVGKLFHKRVRSGMLRLEEAVLKHGSPQVQSNPHLYRQISDSQLTALHAVLEMNSFKAAAESLNKTTSTVHRNFRSLEVLLEQKLADTRPNQIRANAEGEAFYALSKLALREFRQAQSDVEAWKGNFDEAFTVGALPLVQSSILPRALLAFAQEFPQVTVSVVDGTYASMVRQMQRGEIDYVIGALRQSLMSDSIEQFPLFDDALIIVARIGHPLSKLKQITLRDLAAYPWVMPRTASPSRAYFDRFYQSLNRPSHLQCPIETGSFGVLRCILQESDRLGIISAQQATYELQRSILVKLDFPLENSTRAIGVANRSGWFPSPPQSRFLELLGQRQ
ncbi:LysR family transcriptional regulator [Cohaesibacter sp. ES.047]|uniref:LysR family transcriptional regulator n=1 Tax=Cohaesibacter sp. ES.047 TaxID=1798205 RepID=UPI001FCF0B33|nr:LysR family transcriptional regulator [Cohaesibacter sp. ES.047]